MPTRFVPQGQLCKARKRARTITASSVSFRGRRKLCRIPCPHASSLKVNYVRHGGVHKQSRRPPFLSAVEGNDRFQPPPCHMVDYKAESVSATPLSDRWRNKPDPTISQLCCHHAGRRISQWKRPSSVAIVESVGKPEPTSNCQAAQREIQRPRPRRPSSSARAPEFGGGGQSRTSHPRCGSRCPAPPRQG